METKKTLSLSNCSEDEFISNMAIGAQDGFYSPTQAVDFESLLSENTPVAGPGRIESPLLYRHSPLLSSRILMEDIGRIHSPMLSSCVIGSSPFASKGGGLGDICSPPPLLPAEEFYVPERNGSMDFTPSVAMLPHLGRHVVMHPKLVSTLKDLISPPSPRSEAGWSDDSASVTKLNDSEGWSADSIVEMISRSKGRGRRKQGPADTEMRYGRHRAEEVYESEAHVVPVELIRNRRPYTCSACSKTFKNQQTLRMHSKTHSSDNIGSRLGSKMVSMGKNRHNKKNPCKCPHCFRMFVGLYELRRHVGRKHSVGEKQYRCKKCDKGFYIEVDQRDHEKLCGLSIECKCGQKFAFKCNLVAHKKVHPACDERNSPATSSGSDLTILSSSPSPSPGFRNSSPSSGLRNSRLSREIRKEFRPEVKAEVLRPVEAAWRKGSSVSSVNTNVACVTSESPESPSETFFKSLRKFLRSLVSQACYFASATLVEDPWHCLPGLTDEESDDITGVQDQEQLPAELKELKQTVGALVAEVKGDTMAAMGFNSTPQPLPSTTLDGDNAKLLGGHDTPLVQHKVQMFLQAQNLQLAKHNLSSQADPMRTSSGKEATHKALVTEMLKSLERVAQCFLLEQHNLHSHIISLQTCVLEMASLYSPSGLHDKHATEAFQIAQLNFSQSIVNYQMEGICRFLQGVQNNCPELSKSLMTWRLQ